MNGMTEFIKFCMRRNIKDLYAKNKDGEYILLPFHLSYEERSGDEYGAKFYTPKKEETTFTLNEKLNDMFTNGLHNCAACDAPYKEKHICEYCGREFFADFEMYKTQTSK